mgnify:CR=1 FL=1
MTRKILCAAFRCALALIALASSANAQFKDATQFGFLPENDGFKNAEALQKAVDGGGTIAVSKKGVYAISKEIRIGDNTHLIFGADTRLSANISKPANPTSPLLSQSNLKIFALRAVSNFRDVKVPA